MSAGNVTVGVELKKKKQIINIFKILFCSINTHGIHSSRPPGVVLDHHMPATVFAYHGSGAKGVTGEVSPRVPAREPLPNFSRKLILHFPESRRVPSDEVTWLVPRLRVAVGQVNTCALFSWFILFSVGKTAAFHA